MKKSILILLPILIASLSCSKKAKETNVLVESTRNHLFMDVHNLAPGKVTLADVASAHQKDLAAQGKYNVQFLKYWVDEKAGKVYCLAESPDSASMVNAHKEAHGLIPDFVRDVTEGPEALKTNGPLFFDVHYLGAGKVTAADVAKAHEKDLAVQGKYNVNFVDYWVDEKLGVVMCLAESPDSAAMVNAHKEAHGLIPDEVHSVKEGN